MPQGGGLTDRNLLPLPAPLRMPTKFLGKFMLVSQLPGLIPDALTAAAPRA
jgi:hypothetical protein